MTFAEEVKVNWNHQDAFLDLSNPIGKMSQVKARAGNGLIYLFDLKLLVQT